MVLLRYSQRAGVSTVAGSTGRRAVGVGQASGLDCHCDGDFHNVK